MPSGKFYIGAIEEENDRPVYLSKDFNVLSELAWHTPQEQVELFDYDSLHEAVAALLKAFPGISPEYDFDFDSIEKRAKLVDEILLRGFN